MIREPYTAAAAARQHAGQDRRALDDRIYKTPRCFFSFSGSSNHHRLNQAAVDLIWEAHTSDAEKEEAKKII